MHAHTPSILLSLPSAQTDRHTHTHTQTDTHSACSHTRKHLTVCDSVIQSPQWTERYDLFHFISQQTQVKNYTMMNRLEWIKEG